MLDIQSEVMHATFGGDNKDHGKGFVLAALLAVRASLAIFVSTLCSQIRSSALHKNGRTDGSFGSGQGRGS